MTHKITYWIMIAVFALNQLSGVKNAYAISYADFLPKPGIMVNLSPVFEPVLIKGMTIHKDNPFLFDFIIDSGHERKEGKELKSEADRLIKYFFACLTIPEKDLWVNLSPYEKERMVPQALGETALGRDLLAQDYMLKQLTASLIYPEKALGQWFWKEVYDKAFEQFGAINIPVNTFNKVWIVAEKASVYEHNQTAFVLSGHLKVMLAEDYLAQNRGQRPIFSENDSHSKNRALSPILRKIILPAIEKEVNTGKNFAMLRQIFYAQILAFWYKKNLKNAILTQVYADKGTVKGISLDDPSVKEAIYERYLQAYKKGVFNFIKETPTANGQTVTRKYFSGGYIGAGLREDLAQTVPENISATGDYAIVTTRADGDADAAQTSKVQIQTIIRAGASDTLKVQAKWKSMEDQIFGVIGTPFYGTVPAEGVKISSHGKIVVIVHGEEISAYIAGDDGILKEARTARRVDFNQLDFSPDETMFYLFKTNGTVAPQLWMEKNNSFDRYSLLHEADYNANAAHDIFYQGEHYLRVELTNSEVVVVGQYKVNASSGTLNIEEKSERWDVREGGIELRETPYSKHINKTVSSLDAAQLPLKLFNKAMITALTDILIPKNLIEEALKARGVDDIVLLGNDNFETFREALRVFSRGYGKRIVVTGGIGRLTHSLRVQAKQAKVEVNEADTEARMIVQIMEHMIKTEEEFISLRTRNLSEMFILEEQSTNTDENLKNYRSMIEGQKVNTVIFIQTPHQQLRTMANVKKVFSSRISRGTLKALSWTVPYQEEGKDMMEFTKELSGEAWRLVLYSLARKIELNGVYPKGLAGIPDDFWRSAASLFDSLPVDQQEALAHQWLDLVKGFVISERLGQLKPKMREFADKVLRYARVHFIFNDHGYLHQHADEVGRRVREADIIYVESHLQPMIDIFKQVSEGRMEVVDASKKFQEMGGFTANYINKWNTLLIAIYGTHKRIKGEPSNRESEQDILASFSYFGKAIHAFTSSKMPEAVRHYKDGIILMSAAFLKRDRLMLAELTNEINSNIGSKILVIRGELHQIPYLGIQEEFPSTTKDFLGMEEGVRYLSERLILQTYFELAGVATKVKLSSISEQYFLHALVEQFLIETAQVRNPKASMRIIVRLSEGDMLILAKHLHDHVGDSMIARQYALEIREWLVTVGKAMVDEMREALGDAAQTSVIRRGGIDLKILQDGMSVEKDTTGGVVMNFDPAILARVRQEGLRSLVPVIIRMEFLPSIMSLLNG